MGLVIHPLAPLSQIILLARSRWTLFSAQLTVPSNGLSVYDTWGKACCNRSPDPRPPQRRACRGVYCAVEGVGVLVVESAGLRSWVEGGCGTHGYRRNLVQCFEELRGGNGLCGRCEGERGRQGFKDGKGWTCRRRASLRVRLVRYPNFVAQKGCTI